jgi:hypothetical protein
MSVDGPDELLHTVLPPALEVLTAWSIAETEADPTVFRHAMNRAFGDAAGSQDPWRGFADMMFGLSSLSGILLDDSPRPPAGRAASSCMPCICAISTRPGSAHRRLLGAPSRLLGAGPLGAGPRPRQAGERLPGPWDTGVLRGVPVRFPQLIADCWVGHEPANGSASGSCTAGAGGAWDAAGDSLRWEKTGSSPDQR